MNARLSLQSAYYRPSGIITPTAVGLMLGLGTVTALVLGLVYGYLTLYNPFIYISCLATAAFGFALGFMAWQGGMRGKLRSPVAALAIGAVVGVIGTYVNWVVWLHALSGQAGESFWIVNPVEIVSILGLVAEEGVWSLRSWTPTGAALYTVWGIETAILIGVPAWTCRAGATEAPFCEGCEQWTAPELGLVLPAADNTEQLRAEVERGNLAPLRQLASDNPGRFTAVTVHNCPQCQTSAFLTVEDLTITEDKKGEAKESRTDIARFLILTPDALAQAHALAERVENGHLDEVTALAS